MHRASRVSGHRLAPAPAKPSRSPAPALTNAASATCPLPGSFAVVGASGVMASIGPFHDGEGMINLDQALRFAKRAEHEKGESGLRVIELGRSG